MAEPSKLPPLPRVSLARGARSDIEDVLTFWGDATTVESSTDDVDGIATLLAFDPRALIVAREGDRIVGTVITGWDGWRASMYRLAVAPAYRRRGIGRMLVAAGEAHLQSLGARRFHLIVQEGEDSAQSFWRANGYESTEQLRFVKTIA
jgi:ribosomal protein S18 acetylase RimI-like enzyme